MSSVPTLHVLSNKNSSSPQSGSLIVNGGVGINGNVNTNREIVCNEIICKNNADL